MFMAARKLVHYFQAHPISVIYSTPIANIINNRDATGRVTKWATELKSFHITYTPRKAIKSHPSGQKPSLYLPKSTSSIGLYASMVQ